MPSWSRPPRYCCRRLTVSGPRIPSTSRIGLVGVVLFVSGAATGVALVPRAVEILQSFVPVGGSSLLQADAYVDFYTRLVILFGVSFLIPEVLVALNCGLPESVTIFPLGLGPRRAKPPTTFPSTVPPEISTRLSMAEPAPLRAKPP